MAFNLLAAPWLEVRRASGGRDFVRPCDIAGRFDADPVLALDFPRPDWNAALTEFLIGLVFLAMAPQDDEQWAEGFEAPPRPDALAAGLSPFAVAFDFDGDGPRAFQDRDALADGEPKEIGGLLIEAPGENTLRNNGDLFVKRGGAPSLGLPYAAAALITLQTYAPSGGVGHRTSLRGGGPLTTLMAPRRAGTRAASLWDRVWANVPDRDPDTRAPEPAEIFPWLSATRTSAHDEAVTEADSHPGLAFFACPRRIRLIFAPDAVCGLSGDTGPGATGFRARNYGANYKSWRHPLSPYRTDRKSGLLPVHPHAGASNYRDWLAWWGFDGHPARALELWSARRRQVRRHLAEPDGIEAFGFDMDNMKARQWLNARLPWIPLHEGTGGILKTAVNQAITASDEAARALVRAVKFALYGQRQGEDYRLPETLPIDSLKEPGERLWRETEPDFARHLRMLRDRLKAGEARTLDLNGEWLTLLRARTLHIFDETVDIDGLTGGNPHRLLWARGRLSFAFANHPKAGVRNALGLAVTPKAGKAGTEAA